MAHLVFKGHETRGKELHKLLENLGGVDAGYMCCSCVTCYYYINREGYMECSNSIPLYMDKRVIMELDEFERRYPYRVGDKVNYVKYNDWYPSIYTIQRMRWTGVTIEYLLDSSGFSALTKDLQPYKEEAMGKEISGAIIDRFICLEGYDFYDDKGNIIDTKEIIMKKKKPKYPKTYKECCEVLLLNSERATWGIEGLEYKRHLIVCFQRLLICRDSYWKIVGDWKPDWEDGNTTKYTISCVKNKIELRKAHEYTFTLAFPTEEMRDAFYENFKKLIEECKELL
jgi:hypothetical protein